MADSLGQARKALDCLVAMGGPSIREAMTTIVDDLRSEIYISGASSSK